MQVNEVPGIAAAAIARIRQDERRRSERHVLRLDGRIRFEDGRENLCYTMDASTGGLSIHGPRPGPVGSTVMCRFESLGWVEGEIRRHTPGGFGMSFRGTPERLVRIADRVEWLSRRAATGEQDQRKSERLVPLRTVVSISLVGRVLAGSIIDLSRTGVAVACGENPDIGSPVTVGKRRGTVARHLPGGFAVEFKLPIGEAQFDENVVL